MNALAESTSVAVFIDWQNTYRSARAAFGLQHLPGRYGNIDPYRLGLHLANAPRNGELRRVARVEVHRGLPSADREPNANAANHRQVESWIKDHRGVVVPRLRPLRYRHGPNGTFVATEKGIDVQLALAAVTSVVTEQCEVAVIFSHDSDLQPAVEAIRDLKSARHVETASWSSGSFRHRIPPVRGVFNHFIDESAFRQLQDPTDYGRPLGRRTR